MKKIIYISLLLLFSFSNVLAQANALKAQAQSQMKFGRYGEAIDLLNRFISAEPQNYEGYNLRGLCHEKRNQYENAVYDFRSAKKLAPNNKEVSANLSRVVDAWQSLLYNKIEGYKREIAINPNKPVNYLEIGKSFKNLGNWENAELWYDQYLSREDASADEMIRYTEILAKNNHIQKGLPYLKTYTERYPRDHRLWSRYGYFLMWAGQNRAAITAFETALELRPYFKEAQDGLDQAKGKGYIYTINDTSSKYNYGMPTPSKIKAQEYPIDRYYRLLKSNPKDQNTRKKLIEELYAAKRFSEALDQMKLLANELSETEWFSNYWELIKESRDSLATIKVAEYASKVENNPGDREAVKNLASAYAELGDYDEALEVLDKYFEATSSFDKELNYRYAQYATWNYDYEKALNQLNTLLQKDPSNLDYQLLYAQISVWTVSDLNTAIEYFQNVLRKEPNNLYALLGLSSANVWQKDFIASKDYLSKADKLYPESREVEAVKQFYDRAVEAQKQAEVFNIRAEAQQLAMDGNCEQGARMYEDYFTKITAPSKVELAEYADILGCAQEYSAAIEIYNKILDEEYDFDIALRKAALNLWSGDSALALVELQKLSADKPNHFEANFFLGNAYERIRDFDEAESVYNDLLDKHEDSVATFTEKQIAQVNERLTFIDNIEVYSYNPMLSGILSNIAVIPLAAYYQDNQQFRFTSVGGKLETSLTSFMGVGVSLVKTNLSSGVMGSANFTSFKGEVFVKPIESITAKAGFGKTSTEFGTSKPLFDVLAQYNSKNFMAQIGYEKNDARVILYSPTILYNPLEVRLFRAISELTYNKQLVASFNFKYMNISDENKANDFNLRLGKKFDKELTIGYEYFFSNFKFRSYYYYSPQKHNSHSVWGNYDIVDEDDLKLKIGGKIGYIPEGEYIIRELNSSVQYKPLKYFTLAANFNLGSTFREDAAYNSVSAYLSAYLNFF